MIEQAFVLLMDHLYYRANVTLTVSRSSSNDIRPSRFGDTGAIIPDEQPAQAHRITNKRRGIFFFLFCNVVMFKLLKCSKYMIEDHDMTREDIAYEILAFSSIA